MGFWLWWLKKSAFGLLVISAVVIASIVTTYFSLTGYRDEVWFVIGLLFVIVGAIACIVYVIDKLWNYFSRQKEYWRKE